MSEAVRGWLLWSIAALLSAVVWVQVVVSNSTSRPGILIVYTLVPFALLTLTLAVSLWRRGWLDAAALVLATTPTALSLSANSERHGAVAMVSACAAVWLVWSSEQGRRSTRAIVWAGVAGFATIACVLWVASGSVRDGYAPSWTVVTSHTGDSIRLAFATVGEQGSSIPVTAQLAWWCGVGLIVGAAVVAGRRRAACLVPGAVVAIVVVGWAVERFRGPVSAAGGAWLLAAPVAYVGAAARIDRLADVRIGRVVAVIAGFVWAAALAQQIKVAAADPAVPNGDWEFWSGWQIAATNVSPIVLMVVAVSIPAALVGTILAASTASSTPRTSGTGRSRHLSVDAIPTDTVEAVSGRVHGEGSGGAEPLSG